MNSKPLTSKTVVTDPANRTETKDNFVVPTDAVTHLST
jgi:hypothetical protein